jgi:hypothetical protein
VVSRKLERPARRQPVGRPARRKHVGRPASVRGTASNNPRDAHRTGSAPTRGPRSRPTNSRVEGPKPERPARRPGPPTDKAHFVPLSGSEGGKVPARRSASGAGEVGGSVETPKSKSEARTAGEAEAVGRPASVRGTASNSRETHNRRAQLPLAGLEVARPSTRGGSSRAAGVCSRHGPEQARRRVTRRGQVGGAGPEVARPKTERKQFDDQRLARRKQSGGRRLFEAPPRTGHETRRRTAQLRRAGLEVGRPFVTTAGVVFQPPLQPASRRRRC